MKRQYPDCEPRIEVRHEATLQGLLVRAITIDDVGYMVVEYPAPKVERFAFTRHQGDGGSGETYRVFVMGGRAVGCECNDRKYRRRRCKHMAFADAILGPVKVTVTTPTDGAHEDPELDAP